MIVSNLPPTHSLLWGAKKIAAHLGQRERWLRKQLERGKAPPPTFKVGAAVVADVTALDAWIEKYRQRQRAA